MSYLKERISYLRGLAEGMKIDDSTNEGKLLKAIIEVMDDVALAIEDVEDVQEQLSEQVDSIDEDLAEIERIMFDEEDEDYIISEVECPHCNEVFEVSVEDIDDETDTIECPICHQKIEVDWDCDCEDCCDHDDKDEH